MEKLPPQAVDMFEEGWPDPILRSIRTASIANAVAGLGEDGQRHNAEHDRTRQGGVEELDEAFYRLDVDPLPRRDLGAAAGPVESSG